MILSEGNLQKEYDKLKKVAASSAKSFKPATVALPISSLFSTKNFSLTKHTPSTVVDNNNDVSSSNSHDNSVSISAIQDLDNNPITAVSSSTDHQTMLTIQTERLDTEMIASEPNNGDAGLLTPAEVNVLRTVDTTALLNPRTAEQLHYDNCSDATSDSEIESNNNTIECTLSSSNHSELHTAGNKNPNRPILMLKSIPGVIFIDSEEFTFVDKQRLAHPDIKWYPDSEWIDFIHSCIGADFTDLFIVTNEEKKVEIEYDKDGNDEYNDDQNTLELPKPCSIETTQPQISIKTDNHTKPC